LTNQLPTIWDWIKKINLKKNNLKNIKVKSIKKPGSTRVNLTNIWLEITPYKQKQKKSQSTESNNLMSNDKIEKKNQFHKKKLKEKTHLNSS